MKGPYERLKYSMQRLWECPICKHHERTGGEATFRYCGCQSDVAASKQTSMKLIHDGIRRISGSGRPL